MIRKLKSLIKKVVGISTTEVECAIDDDIVECQEIDLESYVGVPACVTTPLDDWFAPPYNMEVNTARDVVTGQPLNYDPITGEAYYEPDDIHEIMYEQATKNGLPWDQGGSETFQENVDLDWTSGTGWGQYR